MRFDTHVHVWVLEPERYPWNPILPQAPVPQEAVPVELLLAELRAAGVAREVAVQPSTYGWDNSYLLDALERHPEELRGVVLVDPAAPDAAATLAALGGRPGVRGVRFHVLDDAHEATFAAAAPSLAAAAAEAGLVVTVQAGPGRLAQVERIARDLPELAVVVDHLGLVGAEGDPVALAALLRLADLENVHVKLSGLEVLSGEPYPFADCRPLAERVVGAFGPGRTMWGSNFPHVRSACTYEQSAALPGLLLPALSAAERAEVESGTATRLWR